jgi:Mg-chelatase subunit ChlI/Mg-chelatase subunit ChlD
MSTTSKRKQGYVFPFNAIIGQENVKTILILNAIDPSIGGALISGPKGTGKSLLVKSFADVLPEIELIAECPFNCSPIDPANMCLSCRSKSMNGEIMVISEKMKIIQVPLSVTEDMLLGSIDMEKAVIQGIKSLEPGLLAEANQNILYIDEVNLLPDHITDSILDAAASGWNTVEREGISVQHPSKFILVGTMNPEEGELRPQILDRFGIFSETSNILEPIARSSVIEKNEKFNKDPIKFTEKYYEDLEKIRKKIQKSRKLLAQVKVPEEVYQIVAETCSRLKVDGFRPDIISIKAARALAAYHGRNQVLIEDVQHSLELTLGHRTRKSGLSPPPLKRDIRRALRISELRQKLNVSLKIPKLAGIVMMPAELIEKLTRLTRYGEVIKTILLGLLLFTVFLFIDWIRFGITKNPSSSISLFLEFLLSVFILIILDRLFSLVQKKDKKMSLGVFDEDYVLKTSGRLKTSDLPPSNIGGSIQSNVSYFGEDTSELDYGPKIMGTIESLQRRLGKGKKKNTAGRKEAGSSGGRRTRVITRSPRGRYAWYQIPKGKPRDIAIVPTIKEAAMKQFDRNRENLMIQSEDIREKVREYSTPYSIVLLVDMSLSMIESVTNIVQSIYDLHSEVYRRRDRVGLVVFKGSKAYTLQHPTRNLDLVVKKIRNVGASDFTPLPAGLFHAWKTLKQEKLRNRDSILHLYVISDGIANVPLDKPLSPLTRRRYTSDTHADSFDVARLLVKEGINVHIVNTNHSDNEKVPLIGKDSRISLKPTPFLIELARVSKGEYIGLKLS